MEKKEVFCLQCQHVGVYIDQCNLEKISCDHPICFGEPEIHKNYYYRGIDWSGSSTGLISQI